MHYRFSLINPLPFLAALLAKLRRRPRPGEGPDLLGSGVPRRPSPGGLVASAAATPESDAR
ncbi:MAG: hypothetical protein ACRDJE_16070 [Dehalococcoidia bacterium]